MNDGRICISICAKTGDELFSQFEKAEPLADVIEVRFDCLDPSEFDPTDHEKANRLLKKLFTVPLRRRPSEVSILSTFRPRSQGGCRELTEAEREHFWDSGYDFEWVDFEEDLMERSFYRLWDRICSYHDFSGMPPDLGEICERLANTGADACKLAIKAEQITDAIPLWKLFERARSEGKPLIPIAMGEAGKWTRILGLAYGSFMTYASVGDGSEVAPGQISAADMIDVFRVKELDRNTEVFGIVAGDTSYSVSPWMHNAAFRAARMNRVFVPLQVADLDEFIRRMVRPGTREIDLNFKGFSVTNPHKQAVIDHLDGIDDTAAKIGAVNTVKIDDGKLFGFNTDAPGFMGPLVERFRDLKDARAAVVGAGGAARACVYALQQEGAKVTLFARNPKKAAELGEEFSIPVKDIPARNELFECEILVNATPLGTKGEHENRKIAAAEQLNGVKLAYDLIYNPLETALIREARAAGVPAIGGLEMVIAQGMRQFEIWTAEAAPADEMAAAVKRKLNL